RGNLSSAEITVQVKAAAPDILTYGSNRAVAINPNGSMNGPGAPTPSGSTIVLYLTGIGPVKPAVATGAPRGPSISHSTLDPHATLNEREVPLAFLGLAPGFVALAQANIEIPKGLASGDYTLALEVGGEKSNAVKLAVVK